MPSAYYRLPEIGSGTTTDPYRPDTLGHDVSQTSGGRSHPDGAPVFLVHIRADSDTLDALGNEPQATRFDNVPTQALNQMFGSERTPTQFDGSLSVAPPIQ